MVLKIVSHKEIQEMVINEDTLTDLPLYENLSMDFSDEQLLSVFKGDKMVENYYIGSRMIHGTINENAYSGYATGTYTGYSSFDIYKHPRTGEEYHVGQFDTPPRGFTLVDYKRVPHWNLYRTENSGLSSEKVIKKLYTGLTGRELPTGFSAGTYYLHDLKHNKYERTSVRMNATEENVKRYGKHIVKYYENHYINGKPFGKLTEEQKQQLLTPNDKAWVYVSLVDVINQDIKKCNKNK